MKITVDKQPTESTRIIFLLDRSTSMSRIREEAVSGFNQYLKEQQESEGFAKISLIFFDSSYHVLYDNLDVKNAPSIFCGPINGDAIKSPYVYVPQGMTSLYDYIHETIMRYKGTAKTGEKTIFAILTDGEDTSSQKHNYQTVQSAIKEVQDGMGWEILFLGANMNAKAFAASVGIKLSNVAQFDVSNIEAAIGTMSFASNYYRGDSKTILRASSAGVAGQSLDMTATYNSMCSGDLKEDNEED